MAHQHSNAHSISSTNQSLSTASCANTASFNSRRQRKTEKGTSTLDTKGSPTRKDEPGRIKREGFGTIPGRDLRSFGQESRRHCKQSPMLYSKTSALVTRRRSRQQKTPCINQTNRLNSYQNRHHTKIAIRVSH
jgi:hypothetical protein